MANFIAREYSRRLAADLKQETYIGQELSELTPVEIAGKNVQWMFVLLRPEWNAECEVDEAGSPLASDNGEFTFSVYDTN